jgi:hypothetical protein
MGLGRHLLAHGLEQARLADAGLADQQDHLALTLPRLGPPP